MKYTIKKLPIQKIDYIIHLADIHIRLQKRQDEYKTVFIRLYNKLTEFVKLNKNTLIYVAGDLTHTKTDMSPEQADLLQDFLKSLCKIAPTIIITGNHDCNLNNRTRLDALQPVVNALQLNNLFYLKDSGVYETENLSFTVMSVFDKPIDFIKAKDINTQKIKIALHHGAVNGSHTSLGFQLTNDNVNLSTFEGYDLTLLGDIHQLQYLNDACTIAYASSIIQQDHGESLENHGYLIWDINSKKSTFVEVENDYGYITCDVINGKLEIPNNFKWPKISRLKVKVDNCTKTEIQDAIAEIKQYTDVQSINIQRLKSSKSTNTNIHSNLDLLDVRDVEIQNKLICEYLETYHDVIDTDILDGIRHVNRLINSKLIKTDSPRNTTYKLKYFEFHNVFSYGPNNSINLQSLEGVYGLFAQNRSGKSSILDSLLFCIFDKCSKTSSANLILNKKSANFKLKLIFELNDIEYYIERIGTKQKSGHVRVSVDFYYFDQLGNKQILNGIERDDTNKIIKKYLGTYEDFILTSISTQNNNTGFIEMRQRDRKELLSKFLDIYIFEELYFTANEEIKSVASVLKEYNKINFSDELNNVQSKIKILSEQYKSLECEYENIKHLNDKCLIDILDLTKQIIPTNADKLDEQKLNIELLAKLKERNELEIKSKNIIDELSNVKLRLTEAEAKVNNYDISSIESSLDVLKMAKLELSKLNLELVSVDHTIAESNKKLKYLSDLKYDENCTYCMNNIFVQDAIKTKTILQDTLNIRNNLESQILKLKAQIENNNAEKLKVEYDAALNHKRIIDTEYTNIQVRIEKLKVTVQNTLNSIKDLEAKIQLVKDSKEILAKNHLLEEQIYNLQLKHVNYKKELSSYTTNMKDLYSKLQVALDTKSRLEQDQSKMIFLEKEYKFYEFYLLAIKHDGVPYDLIRKILPTIESEINNILSQLVDFNILLQTDDKNINIYIVYDNDNYWPIELVSGMERFISSLAIRTALINITSLPKPNFIAIDEGFTQLDAENINSVYMLFSYLKTQFDFVIIISHLELLRDMVDKFMEIKKDSNGFSSIKM